MINIGRKFLPSVDDVLKPHYEQKYPHGRLDDGLRLAHTGGVVRLVERNGRHQGGLRSVLSAFVPVRVPIIQAGPSQKGPD
jgi:hypothetical protein